MKPVTEEQITAALALDPPSVNAVVAELRHYRKAEERRQQGRTPFRVDMRNLHREISPDLTGEDKHHALALVRRRRYIKARAKSSPGAKSEGFSLAEAAAIRWLLDRVGALQRPADAAKEAIEIAKKAVENA